MKLALIRSEARNGFLGMPPAALLLALAVSAETVRAQQPAAPAAAPAATAVERGKQNFVKYACYSCHGHSGNGSDSGPRLDASRLPFAAFSRYVRQPGGSMPPYALPSQIPDAALEDIYAFLQSVPPPPDPKSIPLLNED